MPKVNWGINSSSIDDFDRESQYKPYTGPIPPNATYRWKIKVAKFIAATREKLPQLRLGLELVPRGEYDEKKYAGYFCMAFLPVADNTSFRYVPFLDAIGVSSRDFTSRTITDEEGNIRRIGAWKNDGSTIVLATLEDTFDQRDQPRKSIGWIGPDEESSEDDVDSDYDDEEEEADGDIDSQEYENRRSSTPPRRGMVSKKSTTRARSRNKVSPRRAQTDNDDWD